MSSSSGGSKKPEKNSTAKAKKRQTSDEEIDTTLNKKSKDIPTYSAVNRQPKRIIKPIPSTSKQKIIAEPKLIIRQPAEVPKSNARPSTSQVQMEDDISISSRSSTREAPIPTHNRFSGIPVEPTNDEFDDTESIDEEEIKPAPIIILNHNINQIKFLLSNAIPSLGFQMKIMKIGIRVDTNCMEDHEKAINALKESELSFYRYHTMMTRPIKAVLYGLYDMEEEDLMVKLREINVIPEKIRKFKLKGPVNNRELGYKNAIFLLYFTPMTTSLTKLKRIKVIENICVRWSRYRPNKQTTIAQCHNCQLFGHSSINCFAPPRCAVCAEGHETRLCPNKIPRVTLRQRQSENQEIDKSFVKCVLCGESHTASYTGCVERRKYEEVQRTLDSKNRAKNAWERAQTSRAPETRNLEEYPNLTPNLTPNSTPRLNPKSRSDFVNHQRFQMGATSTIPNSVTTDLFKQTMETMQSMLMTMQQVMANMNQLVVTLSRTLERTQS